MVRLLFPACLILLAACARSEDASTVANDMKQMPQVESVRSIASDDQSVALGEWRQSLQDEQPALEFGPAGTAPLFSMICGEGGGLVLQRHGTVAFGGLQMMTILLGGDTRRVAVQPVQGTVPMLRAAIPATGPLIEELQTEEGPIAIRTGDSTPLVLPYSPMVGEFINGCGSGAPGAGGTTENEMEAVDGAAGNETAGNSL